MNTHVFQTDANTSRIREHLRSSGNPEEHKRRLESIRKRLADAGNGKLLVTELLYSKAHGRSRQTIADKL